MNFKTQTRTEQVLTVMNILAWVVFIGYMVEGGAILVSYSISCVNPEGAKNLYNGLNLYSLRQFNFWHYTLLASFMVALSIMKSFVAFIVVKMLSKFNLKNPFTTEVVKRLEQVSYVAFATWLVTMLSNAHKVFLLEITGELYGSWISGEFIFMVGVVFIISQVFKRGVEIQTENDLTV